VHQKKPSLFSKHKEIHGLASALSTGPLALLFQLARVANQLAARAAGVLFKQHAHRGDVGSLAAARRGCSYQRVPPISRRLLRSRRVLFLLDVRVDYFFYSGQLDGLGLAEEVVNGSH